MDNCREYNFWLSSFSDVRCLRTFLALGNLELYFVAFLQTLVALRSDGTIMHKHIWSIITSDKSVSFRIVEPFDGTFQSFHLLPLGQGSLATGTCPVFPAL